MCDEIGVLGMGSLSRGVSLGGVCVYNCLSPPTKVWGLISDRGADRCPDAIKRQTANEPEPHSGENGLSKHGQLED